MSMKIGDYELSLIAQRNRLLTETEKWRTLAITETALLLLGAVLLIGGAL